VVKEKGLQIKSEILRGYDLVKILGQKEDYILNLELFICELSR